MPHGPRPDFSAPGVDRFKCVRPLILQSVLSVRRLVSVARCGVGLAWGGCKYTGGVAEVSLCC